MRDIEMLARRVAQSIIDAYDNEPTDVVADVDFEFHEFRQRVGDARVDVYARYHHGWFTMNIGVECDNAPD